MTLLHGVAAATPRLRRPPVAAPGPSPRRWPLAVVPVLGLAVVLSAVALLLLRAAAPSDGTVVLPSTAITARTLTVSSVLDETSPLRPGDVVLSIDGAPVAQAGGLQPRMGARSTYVVERDGQLLSVPVELRPWPWGEWLRRNWPAVVLSLAMLLSAGHVYRRRVRDPAAQVLLLTGALAAAATTTFALGAQAVDLASGRAPVAYAAGQLSLACCWLSWLVFTLVFPRPVDPGRAVRLVLAIVALCGGLQLALMLDVVGEGDLFSWRAAALETTFGWIVPPLIVAVALRRYLVARHAPGAHYLTWLLGAFAVCIAAFVSLWMAPAALSAAPLVPWEYVPLAFLPCPLVLTAAVLRFGLFDVKAVAGRSLLYGLLSLALVATYVAVLAFVGTLAIPENRFLPPLIATVVLAVLFHPLRERLQHAISRLLFGSRDEPYVALSRLGRRLAQAGDTSDVLGSITDTVSGALRLPYAAVELVATDGATLRRAAVGAPAEDVLALPVLAAGDLVGRLHLSPRAPATRFEESELRLLLDLAHQAAPALQALRLTVELRRSRQRLLIARAEERRRLQRDLHDGLGPSLAGLLLQVGAARGLLARDQTDRAAACLAVAEDNVVQSASDVRQMLLQLRTPLLDTLGLVGALRHKADSLGAAAGVRLSVHAPGVLPPIPAAVEETVLAVAGEAMTNAVRHSGGSRCDVELSLTDDSAVLRVRDDGTGIAGGRPAGIGLSSMRERADELGGSCVLEQPDEGGTVVAVTLPLHSAA